MAYPSLSPNYLTYKEPSVSSLHGYPSVSQLSCMRSTAPLKFQQLPPGK